jgi:predicted transglutaminase-like cysteine proteinase
MLEELNARFKYTPDSGDTWKVMTNTIGPLAGDCEDYALTAMWFLSNKSWLRFALNMFFMRYILVYGKYRGVGHVVLFDVKNRRWVDNIQRRWVDKLPSDYKMRLPYITPLNFMAWIAKRVFNVFVK